MKRNGFTLIELLVVIGIISMLVGVTIPNFLSARQRANDAKKKSEMQELKNALRLYYNDAASYPETLSSCSSAVDFASGLACDTVYMKKFPSDLGVNTVYYQGDSGNDFCLSTTLDNKSDGDIITSQARCAASCGSNCSGSDRYCACAD